MSTLGGETLRDLRERHRLEQEEAKAADARAESAARRLREEWDSGETGRMTLSFCSSEEEAEAEVAADEADTVIGLYPCDDCGWHWTMETNDAELSEGDEDEVHDLVEQLIAIALGMPKGSGSDDIEKEMRAVFVEKRRELDLETAP